MTFHFIATVNGDQFSAEEKRRFIVYEQDFTALDKIITRIINKLENFRLGHPLFTDLLHDLQSHLHSYRNDLYTDFRLAQSSEIFFQYHKGFLKNAEDSLDCLLNEKSQNEQKLSQLEKLQPYKQDFFQYTESIVAKNLTLALIFTVILKAGVSMMFAPLPLDIAIRWRSRILCFCLQFKKS